MSDPNWELLIGSGGFVASDSGALTEQVTDNLTIHTLSPCTAEEYETMTMTTNKGWISRAGWGLAHVLRPDSTHQFRGVEYAITRCGRNVRADQITAAGYEDRCKRCGKNPS